MNKKKKYPWVVKIYYAGGEVNERVAESKKEALKSAKRAIKYQKNSWIFESIFEGEGMIYLGQIQRIEIKKGE